MFAGLDVASCPPRQALQWLWTNTNLYWIGFYQPVAGRGYAEKKTWVGKYQMLRDMGWGVAPLYVGKQPLTIGQLPKGAVTAEGRKDGLEAARFARVEKMPLLTVIYFDLEGGDAIGPRWQEYYSAWAQAVSSEIYYPGLYVSHRSVTDRFLTSVAHYVSPLTPFMSRPEVWGINVTAHPSSRKNMRDPRTNAIITRYDELDPRESAAADSTSWQYAHACRIWWLDETNKKHPVEMPMWPVDLDSSIYADPGQAVHTTPLDIPVL